MNQKDYERLRRQIEDKSKADLQALERVWELSRGTMPVRESSVHTDGLLEKVKAAVNEIGEGEVFTKKTLTAHLRRTDPSIPQSVQNAVGGILKRMSDAGELNMVRVGKGKRATEYNKVLSPFENPKVEGIALSLDE